MEVIGRIHAHTALFAGEEKPWIVRTECWKGAGDFLDFYVEER